MGKDRVPAEVIGEVVQEYHSGVIGPTTMWTNVFEVLTPDTTEAILDALPPKDREQLRKVYDDVPYSPIEGEEITPVYRLLMRWCSKDTRPADAIWYAALQNMRNVTSFRVLWEQVVGCIAAGQAGNILAEVPTQVQIYLRAVYASQPEALRGVGGNSSARDEVCRWCEAGAPETARA